ncbi:hypothetical protein BDC45DRAFT_495277 [Circinella umbellata]|nr:hypothetical protein BDC45DRAFT_502796 [Circinella umbellata]KAI7859905.1 hypothetical protein BDC45DRAFT_495277 [Circinella umbellata]
MHDDNNYTKLASLFICIMITIIKLSLSLSKSQRYSGYYGVRGKAIIVSALQHELVHKSRITRSDTHPLDELTFIQTILVPECSILLN